MKVEGFLRHALACWLAPSMALRLFGIRTAYRVCRFFTQSAIACTVGISGADLRHRVEEIMSSRRVFAVGRDERSQVAISIAGILVGMVLFGGLSIPVARAQASGSAASAPAERAKLLAEQERPQKEVPLNPKKFDKFVGYYRLSSPVVFAHMYRSEDHFYTQLTDQPPVEVFPESPTEFFATVVAAQWSFVIGSNGQVTEAILHQSGYLRPWLRSSKSANDAFEAERRQRINENKPSPGTEEAIRRQIEEIERTGHALYTEMDAPLAAAAHEQEKQMEGRFKKRGALESLRFSRVLPNGDDDYVATFAHAQVEVIITPLSPDGRIGGLLFRDIP